MVFDRDILNKLFQYCMVLCGDREVAYDLLYQSIEKYLRHAPMDVQSPVAYIRRSARNAFFDGKRREQILSFEGLPDPDQHPSGERSLEAVVIDRITLEQVWQELRPAEREVLYLWAVQDMSATEIALHLEQPRSSVLSRMRRVRQRMQKVYPATDSGGVYE